MNLRLALFCASAVLIGTQIGRSLVDGQVIETVLWVGLFACLLAARVLVYFEERSR